MSKKYDLIRKIENLFDDNQDKKYTRRQLSDMFNVKYSDICNSVKHLSEDFKKMLIFETKEFKCVVCSKVFVAVSRSSAYKYCSDSCKLIEIKKRNKVLKKQKDIKKIKLNKKKLSFEDLYYYDMDNYNGNRLWCLIRDKFTCQDCSSKENLTVHHKDNKGLNLSPENRNNDIDNLITYCLSCHVNNEPEKLKIENYIETKKVSDIYNRL